MITIRSDTAARDQLLCKQMQVLIQKGREYGIDYPDKFPVDPTSAPQTDTTIATDPTTGTGTGTSTSTRAPEDDRHDDDHTMELE